MQPLPASPSLRSAPPRRIVVRAAAPVARARAPKPDADVVVPGEGVRTGLSIAAMIMGPLLQAKQMVALLARTSFSNPLLARGAGLVVGVAGTLARVPLLNNPVTQTALRAAGILMPFVALGILAFDAWAAWQTVTNPQASRMRKGLTIARFATNALATGLWFVPNYGALLAKFPSWASIGFDVWIKALNAKDKAR